MLKRADIIRPYGAKYNSCRQPKILQELNHAEQTKIQQKKHRKKHQTHRFKSGQARKLQQKQKITAAWAFKEKHYRFKINHILKKHYFCVTSPSTTPYI